MMKFDAGELAKNVIQGMQKVEKSGGLPQKAPEQVTALLRSLIAQAQKLTESSSDDALNSSIKKGLALLESQEISTESITKLTAELSARIKEKTAGASNQSTAVSQSSGKGDSPTRSVSQSVSPTRAAKPSAAPKASAAPKGNNVQFSDVSASAYYFDAVQWAVRKGIASGTTADTFSPDAACTRGQTVTFLWRAAGSPVPKSRNHPFTDVSPDAYYYDAVLWAVERGITSGVTETTFDPDAAVTRGQVAVFLYRNAGSPTVKGENSFPDVPNDTYYANAVAWIAAEGIASGTAAAAFEPDAVCTRGQIVTFLYRSKSK